LSSIVEQRTFHTFLNNHSVIIYALLPSTLVTTQTSTAGGNSGGGFRCFVKHGYSATRMEDIAKHAGVTKGTVYLYYANKEELLKAVVRETLLPRVAELEQVLNDTDCSAPELLRRLLQQWGTLVRDNDLVAGLPKLMIGEVSNFPELASLLL